ncbi:MAG: heme exporter protein CcmD [Alphaproteobacteria bacterium]|nr:heme exporter protein CcmD [Alphaproteobacteria bacterium]
MPDFLHMGEYGSFIAAAYIIAAVVMAGLFVASWRRLRERETALADLLETFEEPTSVGPVGIPANDSRYQRDDPPS